MSVVQLRAWAPTIRGGTLRGCRPELLDCPRRGVRLYCEGRAPPVIRSGHPKRIDSVRVLYAILAAAGSARGHRAPSASSERVRFQDPPVHPVTRLGSAARRRVACCGEIRDPWSKPRLLVAEHFRGSASSSPAPALEAERKSSDCSFSHDNGLPMTHIRGCHGDSGELPTEDRFECRMGGTDHHSFVGDCLCRHFSSGRISEDNGCYPTPSDLLAFWPAEGREMSPVYSPAALLLE